MYNLVQVANLFEEFFVCVGIDSIQPDLQGSGGPVFENNWKQWLYIPNQSWELFSFGVWLFLLLILKYTLEHWDLWNY